MHAELLCNSKVLRVNPWSGGIFPSHGGNIPHLGLPPMVSGNNLIIINHMWLIKLGLAWQVNCLLTYYLKLVLHPKYSVYYGVIYFIKLVLVK